jgi:hypothetical protein
MLAPFGLTIRSGTLALVLLATTLYSALLGCLNYIAAFRNAQRNSFFRDPTSSQMGGG